MKKNGKKSIFALAALCLIACVIGMAACGGGGSSTVKLGFYDGDTCLTELSGKAGDAIAELGVIPTPPEKTGYIFDGWTVSGGEAFTSPFLPEKSTKVYVHYSPVPYSVLFKAGRGVGADTTVAATYDADIVVPDSVKKFYLSGYTLVGWSKTEDGAADYALTTPIKNLANKKDDTVVLHAVYEARTSQTDFIIENDTVLAYIGEDTEITLPEKATRVADYAFSQNKNLTKVTVPATYTEIGFGAFEGCDNIEKLTAPFIGGSRTDNRFLAYIFGAASYTDNTFDYRLTGMGSAAGSTVDEYSLTGSFFIPRALRTVTINDEISEIPAGAFYYAYGLERVIVYPDKESVYGVKKVGAHAFEGCHRIGHDVATDTKAEMPWLSAVETFEERSFMGYVAINDYFGSKLTSVGELTAVKTIGKEAFRYNSSLNDITFGDGLESIGDYAFSAVSLMQRAVIPDSCQTIGAHAFESSVYLASVVIGENVQSIGEYAFASCAALTEVFFKGETLPTLGKSVFEGITLSDSGNEPRPQGNYGLVFYMNTPEQAIAATDTLKAQCSGAKIDVADYEREKTVYYYVGDDFDFGMTLSAGHTMILSDPFMRAGFGIPTIVGTYRQETDVWYNARIYTLRLMLDYDFTVKLDYNLSSYRTHYYIYRTDSFTIDEQDPALMGGFTVGNKQTDEWYLEENKWGQIGLWHNGAFVELYKDPADPDGKFGRTATYAMGGISQMYSASSPTERRARTFMYRQGNAYFEAIEQNGYDFTYLPDISDEITRYNGTLLVDETEQKMLFGEYDSIKKDAHVFVDAAQTKISVRVGDKTIADGAYTVVGDSAFGKSHIEQQESEDVPGKKEDVTVYDDFVLTVPLKEGGDTLTVTFTDFLQSVVEGNAERHIYARIKFTYNATSYVLYNDKYASLTKYYYMANGTTRNPDEYYVLIQYHQYFVEEISDEDAMAYDLYPGFGEHKYSVRNKGAFYDILTYTYKEENGRNYFEFKVEEHRGDNVSTAEIEPYQGVVENSFVGTFVAPTPETNNANRTHAPFYEEEENQTFYNGAISITLSGYGTAKYSDGENVINGTYNVVSDEAVGQVYVSAGVYYNLVEYVFRSDDGEFTQYFVPNFHDSYTGGMQKGDMFLPDGLRGRTYRVYNSELRCTGEFHAFGYGQGILYVMVSPDGEHFTPVDQASMFAAGATYANYEQIGERGGRPVYRIFDGLDQGFFTFIPSEKEINGYLSWDLAQTKAYVMQVDELYDEWWRSPAALRLTGKYGPEKEEMEHVFSREEYGDYVSPNTYTLHLDGEGNATLADASGAIKQSGRYLSIDEGVLGVATYPLLYTVDKDLDLRAIDINDKKTYEGKNVVIGSFDPTAGIVRLALTDGNTPVNNFCKGSVSATYTTADSGTFALYAARDKQTCYVGRMYTDNGKTVFDMGEYEAGDNGSYIFRFDSVKFVVTVQGNTLTVNETFNATRILPGATYRATAYYKPELLSKEELETAKTTTIGEGDHTYSVVANEDGTPKVNEKSEYVGSWIDTQEKNVYYGSGSKVYIMDFAVYEDGEIISSYDLLNIIKVTNKGWYYPKTAEDGTHTKDSYFILEYSNAIVKYTYNGTSQG